ncbi:unnamed protein product [Paramecium octaurelia]|uniref:Uncharacterized protein n=1 Tax=Paramecium octaurelia TaxID=43137 RepID=A0A8S1T5D2_PAROT|nr:unnamed protein product [Paramecium octaurelia]
MNDNKSQPELIKTKVVNNNNHVLIKKEEQSLSRLPWQMTKQPFDSILNISQCLQSQVIPFEIYINLELSAHALLGLFQKLNIIVHKLKENQPNNLELKDLNLLYCERKKSRYTMHFRLDKLSILSRPKNGRGNC